jgi:Glycosyltransferase family 9 (heptosyltransferase)
MTMDFGMEVRSEDRSARIRRVGATWHAGSTAILNGFGRSLGDSIIGLQALTLALAAGTIAPDPVLLRLPGLPAITRQLYDAARPMASVGTLPWADEKPGLRPDAASGFDKVIDLRDFAFDPGFRGIAMIDYFLQRLGLDPGQVPAAQKRNGWLASRVQPAPQFLKPGYVLLCPTAAMPIRCMPVPVHEAAMAWLRAHTDQPVVSQASLPCETSLAGLCGLVASAGLIVSADTAMVHLAAAFSVPCLAFFTTHRPEWRVRDYPLCRAVHLPAALPTALEFARDDDDRKAALAAWFPDGPHLGWLDRALGDGLALWLRSVQDLPAHDRHEV